ncbi:LysR family transcriptional regulator [Agrobacterium cavarae]|uniref:LysR family transcriptional regulator n=1 Tax=Agrobacterium cavarae TaxID=2528239 RepID=UPI000DDFCFBD
MISDLPSPLLRSFVAVVECGSLSAAAVRLGRSESAISLQMSKLENLVGSPLFDRDGRALKVNQMGRSLLLHSHIILTTIDRARAELERASTTHFRIGVVQDFVDGVLKPSLADIKREYPGALISILIGSTSELLKALSEDRIDAAVCASDPVSGPPDIALQAKWFGDPHHASGGVVSLVGITGPCPFMTAAQAALDRAGIAWNVVLETPSLEGVAAAVNAGLGVTCRTSAGIDCSVLARGLLPDLPRIVYSVVERRAAGNFSHLSGQVLKHHLLAITDS